ncbi:MAG: hypothetical protein IH898_08430 [Planctomycetes bacterium]|nr:hypothetical protein [Planctomycetota bacterium]
MNATFTAISLLAQYSKWRRLGDGVRRSRVELSELMPFFIVMVVIGIAIAVGVQIYKRYDYSKPCDDPLKLFRQLCAAHKLNFSSRRLLLQLATALEMPQPAALFVTPAAFRRSELPPQLQGEAERIKKLAHRLF